MIGRSFSRLTVLREMKRRQNRKIAYLCRCECGTEVVCLGSNLRNGNTKSCGCYKSERTRATKFKHGRDTSDTTYRIWTGIHNRCRNPRCKGYPRYGGRGIRVCDRWRSFENFLADMGDRPPGLSIDRIDNDGHYEPLNCRWATNSQQQRNKGSRRTKEAT